MNVKPILNEADIKLLTKTFATKEDMEAGFAKIEKRFDDMDMALTKYSQEIEARIEKLEDAVGISVVN